MSIYAGGRHRPHPDSPSSTRCSWALCTVSVSYRFLDANVLLCQDHALLTWAAVQAMQEDSQIPKGLPPLPKADPQTSGYVYYLRIGDRVKIGHTTDLDRRLATYPPTMEVLKIRKGGRQLERDEHSRFSPWRTDGREWFEANAEVLKRIAEIDSPETDDLWDPGDFQRRTHQPQVVTHRKRERSRRGH
ncbi:GIY-YIG nuclease family protein [Nocardia asiatica]|uniref:GIY-YIG nuclease family protein n=1 Tax=Nocardia asiatica TaxID=209252 RepID=UPI0012F941E3|nr:GIY-YIG nuclease family protein [Nocardia asiatica]